MCACLLCLCNSVASRHGLAHCTLPLIACPHLSLLYRNTQHQDKLSLPMSLHMHPSHYCLLCCKEKMKTSSTHTFTFEGPHPF